MSTGQVVAIIPARYKSSRFPGKPLADIHGRPMIAHVYDRARDAAGVDRVVVATDDARIMEAVRAFGGEAVLTSDRHPTGTDRVAEAARLLDAGIVVNVQGDEPLLDPRMIEQVMAPVISGEVPVATLLSPIREVDEALDTNIVKALTDLQGNVLSFSRWPVPYPKQRTGYPLRRQIGLYAFTRAALEAFVGWPPSPLEQTESVELYRFLEHGWKVRAVETAAMTVPVDTPEDLERVRKLVPRRRRKAVHA